MGDIFVSRDTSFNAMADVAVGVHRSGGHIGMLYRDEAGREIRLIHLAGHFDLRSEPPRDAAYPVWAAVDLPPRRDRMIAGLCRLIYERSLVKQIPYAFGRPDDVFDESGGLHLGPGRLGLTCATFVLAVFHASGVPLVEAADWPARDTDAIWRAEVIAQLRRWRADEAHVTALEADGTSVRFYPREVAGASASPALPASFQQALANAAVIEQMLDGARS